jgi:hypothetical protein
VTQDGAIDLGFDTLSSDAHVWASRHTTTPPASAGDGVEELARAGHDSPQVDLSAASAVVEAL